jgi:hypothetical protein
MPNAFADTANLTLLLLLTIVCLGACFVWAFWEIEQIRERWRQKARATAARARAGANRSF